MIQLSRNSLTLAQPRFGIRFATIYDREDPELSRQQMGLIKGWAGLHGMQRDLYERARLLLPSGIQDTLQLSDEAQARFDALQRQGERLKQRLAKTGLPVDDDEQLFDVVQLARYKDMAEALEQLSQGYQVLQGLPRNTREAAKKRARLEQKWWRRGLQKQGIASQLESLASALLVPNWMNRPMGNYAHIPVTSAQQGQLIEWAHSDALVQGMQDLAMVRHFKRPSAIHREYEEETAYMTKWHQALMGDKTSLYARLCNKGIAIFHGLRQKKANHLYLIAATRDKFQLASFAKQDEMSRRTRGKRERQRVRRLVDLGRVDRLNKLLLALEAST